MAARGDTLYRVYDGKRASEVAPGVGQKTDIAVIYRDRSEPASSELLQALLKIFNESGGKVPASLDPISRLVPGGANARPK